MEVTTVVLAMEVAGVGCCGSGGGSGRDRSNAIDLNGDGTRYARKVEFQ